MVRLFVAALIALSLTLTLVAYQEEPTSGRPLVRDPWHAFPVDSWIIESETLKQDGKVTQSRREKTVRIENRDLGRDEILISVQREQDGEFRDSGGWRLHVYGAIPAEMENSKLLETREETLEIDGRSFQCEVKTWRVSGGRNGIEARYTLWYSKAADVPYRELSTQGPDLAMPPDVLRADVEITTPRLKETASLEVKSLRDERKLGARPLTCIREEGTYKTEAQGREIELSTRRWLAREVPGHVVLSTADGSLGTSKVERRRELVDFHVPERAASAGGRSD